MDLWICFSSHQRYPGSRLYHDRGCRLGVTKTYHHCSGKNFYKSPRSFIRYITFTSLFLILHVAVRLETGRAIECLTNTFKVSPSRLRGPSLERHAHITIDMHHVDYPKSRDPTCPYGKAFIQSPLKPIEPLPVGSSNSVSMLSSVSR